jgi:predicted HNH restriction endonuclease
MTTKEFGLGNFNGSRTRLLAEAEKCDLVCANCHALRHLVVAETPSAAQVRLRRETKLRAVKWFGGSCSGCGGQFPAAVFQFHHLDASSKVFTISGDGINRSWNKTLAELAKCTMLCANCHREVHAGVRLLQRTPDAPMVATG